MELVDHLFLVFPSNTWNSFGGVDAPPPKFGSRLAFSLYRWYRRASMHVPCGLCPSLSQRYRYSALWHVPAALSPCALCTLDELLDILGFSHGRFLNTNHAQTNFLLLSSVIPTCCCIQGSAIWSCQRLMFSSVRTLFRRSRSAPRVGVQHGLRDVDNQICNIFPRDVVKPEKLECCSGA